MFSQESWEAEARRLTLDAARIYDTFSADDVWDFGLTKHPTNSRELGKVLVRLRCEGMIEKIGQTHEGRRRSHGTPVGIWRLVRDQLVIS